jgi:hypothetical protein
MKTKCFHDFDAFTESISGLESRMLLLNPARRLWSISSVDLAGIRVQLGRLGSGNIAQAEIWQTTSRHAANQPAVTIPRAD